MAGAQLPHDLRLTAEALPVVVGRNVVDDAARQILRDALATEHVDALGAAVHLAALAAPAAVQLAAVFAAIELATVVERETFAALRRLQHRMHFDVRFAGRRTAQMRLARGAVQISVDHIVDVRVFGNVGTTLDVLDVRFEAELEACGHDYSKMLILRSTNT